MNRGLPKTALQRKIYKLEQETFELKKQNQELLMVLENHKDRNII